MLFRRFVSSTASATKFSLPQNIRQLLARTGTDDSTQATVSGWIKSIRKQKNFSFAVLTDGSTAKNLQAVLVKTKDDEVLRRLTNGAAVQLTGRLVPSPASGQSHELLVDENDGGCIKILGECDPATYPIQKQALTPEYLRDHVHLRARTSHIAAMLRLRDILGRRINSWFESHDFCHVNTPIITANDAEGAGETFRLSPLNSRHPDAASQRPSPTDFFSTPAFLTVSHQLHLEALATALSRVYSLSPCFRAEPSDTGRHLAEFWMLEAEWAFPTPDGVHGVCNLTEALLRETITDLLKNGEDIQVLWKDADEQKRPALIDAFTSSVPWTRMSYADSIKELEKAFSSAAVCFTYKPEWGRPLQSEHERWLAETLVGGPVFVTDYPASLKPFYMRVNADEKTVACFDLLVPHVGEIIGGSVREERFELLEMKMREAGLIGNGSGEMGKGSGYKWYLDLRRDGGAPHAGFGMGFERLVSWLSGIENVRECIPMPRWAGRMLL